MERPGFGAHEIGHVLLLRIGVLGPGGEVLFDVGDGAEQDRTVADAPAAFGFSQPNRLDDYIIGLKKSYVDQLERQKKNGDVLDYHILVNTSPNAAGATIVFLTKYKDWNALIPNKERDLKEQDEFRKTISKTDEEKMGEDRSKFRTFLDDGIYSDVTYLK